MAEADTSMAIHDPSNLNTSLDQHQHQHQQQQQQHQSPTNTQHGNNDDDDDDSLSDSSSDGGGNDHNNSLNSSQHPHDPSNPPPLPSHDTTTTTSTTSSASSPFVPSGHNKTKGGYRKVIRKDKQKHNESESRRRSRLRGQFMELRTAAKCSKKDRFSILNHALERFAYLEDKVGALEKQLRLKGEDGEPSGEGLKGEGDGSGVEGSSAGGGSAIGGANSSFSAPSSLLRGTSESSTAGSALKPSDTTSLNGSGSGSNYTSSFHSYDPTNPSSTKQSNNNNSTSHSSSSVTPTATTATTNMKLLSDPLQNYPILACLPTCFIALDGKFKDTNTALTAMLGYSRDSLLQTTLFTVTHPNELMNTFAQLKRLLGGEVECWEGAKLLVRGDGSVLSVHMTITCAKKYGKPDLYVGFFVPKANAEGGVVPSVSSPLPQSQSHVGPPPAMQPMYGGVTGGGAMSRGPMQQPQHGVGGVGALSRAAHSPFSPLASFQPPYGGDPLLTSPHSRSMGGGGPFMPPGSQQSSTLSVSQSQPMYGASGQQT